MDAGFTNPEHLVGTADSVIGELAGWLAGPAGGLLKRTFRCAEDVSEAKRARAAALASSPQSGHLVSQVPSTLAAGSLLSLLGPEASAEAVASALTAGSIVVDLNGMLEKAAVKDLPYHLRPQPALFQLLAAVNKSAQEAVPVRAWGVTRQGLASLTGTPTQTQRHWERWRGPSSSSCRSPGTSATWYSGRSNGADDVAHGAVTCKPDV